MEKEHLPYFFNPAVPTENEIQPMIEKPCLILCSQLGEFSAMDPWHFWSVGHELVVKKIEDRVRSLIPVNEIPPATVLVDVELRNVEASEDAEDEPFSPWHGPDTRPPLIRWLEIEIVSTVSYVFDSKFDFVVLHWCCSKKEHASPYQPHSLNRSSTSLKTWSTVFPASKSSFSVGESRSK